MKRQITLIFAPLWQYLNQPIFDSQSVWDLKYFGYLYRIKLLRKCWEKECLPEDSTHSQ